MPRSALRIAFEMSARRISTRQLRIAGGMALAEFHLGHRLSFGLNLFTVESDLILPFSQRVEAACPPADSDAGRLFSF